MKFFQVALSALLLGSAFQFAAGSEAKPNIIFILADDLGYGDLGCFNPHSKIATPEIDSLALHGMKFTDAHAPGPLCHPSRYGLLTGRYPFRVDVTKWPSQPLIRKDEVTIASLLKSQGYQTAMVGKWHLGFEEKGYDKLLAGGPVDHGFETFLGTRASTDITPYFWIRGNRAVEEPMNHINENHSEGWDHNQGAFYRGGGISPDYNHTDVLPKLTTEAVRIIHAHQGDVRPLFLYLAFTAPHTPWLPLPEFVGKSGAGMYGDFVSMVDSEVGRVLKALDGAGMTKDTLVILTSDNGPMWLPTDITRLGHAAAGSLRGMKGDVWEAGHRMPFIVSWPGKVRAASESGQTICFTDILATFADVCNVKLPDGAGADSFSFLPVLKGRQAEENPIRGPIVMQAGTTDAMMIRSGKWKLIDRLGSGGFTLPNKIKPGAGDPAAQLYNLADDLAEKNNLYSEKPEIVAGLTAEMKRIAGAKYRRLLAKP